MFKRLILFCGAIILSISVFAGIPGFSSMKGWVVIAKENPAFTGVLFCMKDDVLQVAGGNAGYIRTEKSYRSYTLTVEWRWIGQKGNSGVLVDMQMPDGVWPTCYQAQLKVGAAGDIICMNGLPANECTDTVKFTVPKKLTANEKPHGEWNQIKIVSKDDTLTIYVNGELQNKITGKSATGGFIGFQAEGQAMEFRNLVIRGR